MTLDVVGHRVLVEPEFQKETTDTGIYIGHTDTFKREQGATTIGTIVGIGPNAWLDFKSADKDGNPILGKPWAKIGDKVYYAKYAGKEIKIGGEVKYVIINDEDVQCIINPDADELEEEV